MPRLDRYKKKGEPDAPSMLTDVLFRKRILITVWVTERFVFISCVTMDMVQLMTLTPSIAERAKQHRYLRT